MSQVVEFHQVGELSELRQEWGILHRQTAGASFFQSLEWLEIYWKHFGKGQRLRVLTVRSANRLTGILPLVVRRESTRVGPIRTLTLPLHDWGSFYSPLGPDPDGTLAVALEHIRRTPRDWDVFELRWQGAPGTDPTRTVAVMGAAGFPPYTTVWNQTAVVERTGGWESYWSSRQSAWLRRFRSAESKLSQQGDISYERYRPRGLSYDDDSPRWDLYDACETIAQQSWQGAATNGTTLSHPSVRGFLREVHQAAAAAGAVDLNLLSIDGKPVAFIYNYCFQGYVSGLRRGYDAKKCKTGAGNVLLVRSLQDSFARGDNIYDLGVGSLANKRHYQTRVVPILRFSYFPILPLRIQLLRAKRWWQQQRTPASIAVGRVQDGTADAR
jgi:CelD/BcsL family acetyltransferase involved in cellulose biosynthesis